MNLFPPSGPEVTLVLTLYATSVGLGRPPRQSHLELFSIGVNKVHDSPSFLARHDGPSLIRSLSSSSVGSSRLDGSASLLRKATESATVRAENIYDLI